MQLDVAQSVERRHPGARTFGPIAEVVDRRLVVAFGRRERVDGGFGKRGSPGEHLVQRDAQRELIGTRGRRLPAVLFGRHVQVAAHRRKGGPARMGFRRLVASVGSSRPAIPSSTTQMRP